MRADRKALADELLRASREHDSNQEDRLARFRNVEPEMAELLSLLVAATGARRVLEIGTSNGYSTVWLADAVDQTGGRLLSVEIDPERTALAKANLERAGLDGPTELRTTDAAELLPELEDESVDLVFLDAERRRTPATGRSSSASSRQAVCWPSTTPSHTSTSWWSSRHWWRPTMRCSARWCRSAQASYWS